MALPIYSAYWCIFIILLVHSSLHYHTETLLVYPCSLVKANKTTEQCSSASTTSTAVLDVARHVLHPHGGLSRRPSGVCWLVPGTGRHVQRACLDQSLFFCAAHCVYWTSHIYHTWVSWWSNLYGCLSSEEKSYNSLPLGLPWDKSSSSHSTSLPYTYSYPLYGK
jgi:hypothetical protein